MTSLKILASHPVQYQAPFFRALAERGVQFEVGYYHGGTALNRGLDAEMGIEIQWDLDMLSGYPHRFFTTRPHPYRLAHQIRLLHRLLAWVFRQPAQPILLVGWFIEAVWLIWLLAIILGKPVMVYGDTHLASYRASPKPVWRISLLRWLLSRSTGLYAGLLNKHFLMEMGVPEHHLFPVPQSVENARFEAVARQSLPNRSELCRQFGLQPDLPAFLFCGKLSSIKKPLELLDAYVKADLSDRAQLIFVGEGPLRSQIEQRIQEAQLPHVHLLGFMNQTQIPLAYVLGEILCLISAETWGLVVNEAMACARPVIVSDAVGCAPDLVDASNGWVVPAGDPLALAAVLRQAYESRHTWAEKGCRSAQKISVYSHAAMAEGILRALQNLENKKSRLGCQ